MRARGAQAQTGARARRASKDRRAREVREQGARALRTHARANKLSKSGFGELICDLESLFARTKSLFANMRASWPCLRTSRAHLYLLARELARARACRCSRTSRAHVLNARALTLRTPQLVRHHTWIHMFWIKPIYICIIIYNMWMCVGTVSSPIFPGTCFALTTHVFCRIPKDWNILGPRNFMIFFPYFSICFHIFPYFS